MFPIFLARREKARAGDAATASSVGDGVVEGIEEATIGTFKSMIIWIVEKGELVQYERFGICNQCGECCCKHTINCEYQVKFKANIPESLTYDSKKFDEEDWSSFESWAAVWHEGFWFWLRCETQDEMSEHPCPSLEDNKCLWWEKDKLPGLCRLWPVHPRDLELFPNCSFRFERKNADEKA